MPTSLDVARDPSSVNAVLAEMVSSGVSEVLEAAATGVEPRALEEAVWSLMLSFGRTLLSSCMASACKRATEVDIKQRGLAPNEILMRMDRDYWVTQMTTLGAILFPLFAYRERRPGATVTRTPARAAVVPLAGRCRSSQLCLEWEARLGKDLPFRRAQAALRFFSHGAVQEEDTTLAAHMVAVGRAVTRDWLYKPVPEIRRILTETATRDAETGRPIVYLSTDAHAERRYVDKTWKAAWKSLNGLRLWAIDRTTGATLHLGGEFTWGDCHEVGRIVDALITDGILPVDGVYSAELSAELVVITDGLPWIERYMLAKLPWAHTILDLYHALERLSSFAAASFGAGSKAAKAFYRRVSRWLSPRRRSRRASSAPRKGHKKRPNTSNTSNTKRQFGSIWSVLGTLYEDEAPTIPGDAQDDFQRLLGYFENNAYRGDYHRYEARGFQLGSGAMESLHRTAAQMRIKLAGARWLPETSLAIVNLRMLDIVGRWDEFWRHDGITPFITNAFSTKHADDSA